MRLHDFRLISRTPQARFVTQITDVAGADTFELTIAGDDRLVREAFDDATIELTIDSSQSEKQLMPELESARLHQRRTMWELAALDRVGDLLKPEAEPLRLESTILAAIRPLSGHGTFFDFRFSNVTITRGSSAWCLVCPWVNIAFGTVAPITGDQDMYLYLFKPQGVLVSASTFPGTTVDLVAFGSPLPFVPVFEWRGFTTGRCNGRCMGA